MKVNLHCKADDDYWREKAYYSEIHDVLARKFEKSVNSVLGKISKNPFLCHNRGDGIFSVRLREFPLSVFFTLRSDTIYILAICHERRNPEIWKDRQK